MTLEERCDKIVQKQVYLTLELESARLEIARLKRGEFTPAEEVDIAARLHTRWPGNNEGDRCLAVCRRIGDKAVGIRYGIVKPHASYKFNGEVYYTWNMESSVTVPAERWS